MIEERMRGAVELSSMIPIVDDPAYTESDAVLQILGLNANGSRGSTACWSQPNGSTKLLACSPRAGRKTQHLRAFL